MSVHSLAQSSRRGLTQPDSSEEAELIDRIRKRDIDAFELLYRNYQQRLSRFVMNVVRRPHLVEEVTNDTMLVVWNSADSFRGASKLSTWIFAIAYRKSMKALRRWDDPLEDDESDSQVAANDAPDMEASRLQTRKLLNAALSELSPDHRAVVDLTYFHGLNYREIAEIVDCPVDTVKTRMFHARRRLKSALAGELSDWI